MRWVKPLCGMVANYQGNKQLRSVTMQLRLELVQDNGAKPLSRIWGYQTQNSCDVWCICIASASPWILTQLIRNEVEGWLLVFNPTNATAEAPSSSMIHLKPLPCSSLFFSLFHFKVLLLLMEVTSSWVFISLLNPSQIPIGRFQTCNFFFFFFLYVRKFGKPVYEHDMYS